MSREILSKISNLIAWYAPEAIRRKIPIRAQNLEEFVELLQKEEAPYVNAEAIIRPKGISHLSWVVENLGNWEYSTRLSSETADGRPIVFTEVHGTRFGSDSDYVDREEREEWALRVLVTADARLASIKERVPYIQASVSEDERFTEVMDKWLRGGAAMSEITPFPPQESDS